MATSKRSSAKKISDPKAHFSSWDYSIEAHHYESLGVNYRQFMKDKKPFWSWAVTDTEEPQIEVGSTFYLRCQPREFLQVVSDWDAFHIEVHLGYVGIDKCRRAFAMTPKQLIELLKTGRLSSNVKSLDLASSKAGLLAWQISEVPELLD